MREMKKKKRDENTIVYVSAPSSTAFSLWMNIFPSPC